MKSSDVIFNLNKMPFSDFDSAARMRDLLMKESGNSYQVEQYDREIDDEDRFVVVRSTMVTQHAPISDSQQTGENITNSIEGIENTVTDSGAMDVREYRPALRSYLMYIPLFVMCLFLLVFSDEIWSLVLSIIGINLSLGREDMRLLVQITQALAAAILLLNSISLLYRYYSVLLIVDDDGVSLRKGIIAREFISIRFSEIKTVGIKQGIVARLLNIGNLELSSSGSDGIDITFFNVANPSAIKDFISNRVKK